MSYLGFVIATLIIGLVASSNVNSKLKKYSKVASRFGMTGQQMAYQMLSANGASGVHVKIGAPGENHFDPRNNSITLEPNVFQGTSVTAIATACHEAGHACQYAEDYTPMKIRGSLVPVVNFASNTWIFILILGIFLRITGLVTLGIIVFAVVVIFQLVTLPVEFNASNRGLAYLTNIGISEDEKKGASSVLRACALTYVAAALTSILQLLYLLGQNRD